MKIDAKENLRKTLVIRTSFQKLMWDKSTTMSENRGATYAKVVGQIQVEEGIQEGQ